MLYHMNNDLPNMGYKNKQGEVHGIGLIHEDSHV